MKIRVDRGCDCRIADGNQLEKYTALSNGIDSENMSNSDQHPGNVEEDHQQKVKEDCSYTFLSNGSSSQLDEFLDLWREEIYRKQRILRLNDDCFFKIFSYLPVNDLCTMSETCRDMKRLSHDYIKAHSKRFCLMERRSFYADSSDIRLTDAKRVIRNFGQYVTQLWLKNSDFHSDDKPIRLLSVLDRYCTNLKELLLDVTLADPMEIVQFERLTPNLNRLSIGAYRVSTFDTPLFGPINVDVILTHCVSLKHLELLGLHWIADEEAYVTKRFEKLESLSLRNSALPSIDKFAAFLSENTQLKRVRISSCFVFDNSREEGFTLTLPSLPNLESFWLRFRDNKHLIAANKINEPSIRRLLLTDITGNVPVLKKLRMDLNIFDKSNLNSLLTRLAANNIIEDIDISNCHGFPDELESYLCALTTLKVLKFTCVDGFSNKIIKKLACGLPNVTYVAFHYCAHVDFTMIESFMEYSHKINKIALFMQVDETRPQLPNNQITRTALSSMVNARLRNKHNNRTLSLIVNERIMSQRKIHKNGIREPLLDCASVIKVLPSVLVFGKASNPLNFKTY